MQTQHFKEREQRVEEGGERGGGRGGGREVKERERGYSPEAHIWFALRKRELGKNSSLNDLSPISVETADNGDDTLTAAVNNKTKGDQLGDCV